MSGSSDKRRRGSGAARGGAHARGRAMGADPDHGYAGGPSVADTGIPDYPSDPRLAYGDATTPANPLHLDSPVTAPPSYASRDAHLGPPSEAPPHLQASAPPDYSGDLSSAPIVQAGTVTGRSLTVVIAIMCFLACLTAGAVYMMYQAANAWLANMSNEITVQIEPVENLDTDQTVREIVSFLRLRRGIATVNPLDARDSAKLLEPWLGNIDALKDLPVPRLIAIEIDGRAPPDLGRLAALLKEQFPKAILDDHRQWRKQIQTVTRSFVLGGFAILALVGLATVGIIISATGSAMAANRDIVEVLNFVGATDRFIAHEFEKHFLTLGIRAGVIGAALAMIVFWTLPMIMVLLGGGSVGLDELQRLVGIGSLDLFGYMILAMVVVIIAALCMVTSRFGVFRILNQQT
jgi:cell division transport system permease protein